MGQVSKPDSKMFNCLYNIKLKWHHNNFPVDQWTDWRLQGTSRDRTALSCSLRNVKLSPENLAETCPDKSADRSHYFYIIGICLYSVRLSVSHFNVVELQVPRQQCSNVPRQECKQVIFKTVQTSVNHFSNLKSNRFHHKYNFRCRGRSVSKSRGPHV